MAHALVLFQFFSLVTTLKFSSPEYNSNQEFYLLAKWTLFCRAPPTKDHALVIPLVLADPLTACEPLKNNVSGAAVVYQRGGGCTSVSKVNTTRMSGALVALNFNSLESDLTQPGNIADQSLLDIQDPLDGIFCYGLRYQDGSFLQGLLSSPNNTVLAIIYQEPLNPSQRLPLEALLTQASNQTISWKSFVGNSDLWKWNLSSDPCTMSYSDIPSRGWAGVWCSDDGDVSILHLPFAVQGTLPDLLGSLANIEIFIQGEQDLTFLGILPPSLVSWSSLKYIQITQTQISGVSSEVLNGWTELTYSDFSFNQLAGPFPEIVGLKLRYLDFSNNQFTGVLPANLFSNLPNIEQMALANNFLEGPLPSIIAHTHLQSLLLNFNRLNGSISAVSFPVLHRLALDHNNFSAWDDLGPNASNSLTILDLSYNQLSFTPPAFVGLNNLTVLDLSFNPLGSNLPDFSVLTMLQQLGLSGIGLSDFPPFLPVSLEKFDASQNKIKTLAPQFTSLSQLTYIDLSFNYLSGDIYNILFSLPNPGPETIILSHNNITAEGTDSITLEAIFSTFLVSLDLSYNQIRDPLPIRSDIPDSLLSLDLSNNDFYGSIPDLYSTLPFTFLNLGTTNISSSILPPFLSYSFGSGVHEFYNLGLECPRIYWQNRETMSLFIDPSYHQYRLCRCLEGYYSLANTYSQCFLCPEHASCPGLEDPVDRASNVNIVALPGFYPLPSNTDVQMLVPCDYASVTPDSPGNPCNPNAILGTRNNISSMNYDFTDVKGIQFECLEGHTDRYCSKCASGYFWRTGNCVNCADSPLYFVTTTFLFAFFVLGLAFYTLRPPIVVEFDSPKNLTPKIPQRKSVDSRRPSHEVNLNGEMLRSRSPTPTPIPASPISSKPKAKWSFYYEPGVLAMVSLCINHFQTISIMISKFRTAPATTTSESILRVLSFASTDSLGFECWLPLFRDYRTQWSWILVTPYILIAILGLLFLLKIFYLRCIKRQRIDFQLQFALFVYALHNFFNYIYLPLSLHVIRLFQCHQDPISGEFYLSDRPYLPCDVISSQYKLAALLLVVVGNFLLFASLILFITRAKQETREKPFLVQAFGGNYLVYRPTVVWGNFFFLMRKVAVSLVVGLVPSQTDIFPSLILLILLANLLFVYFKQPFRYTHWNYVAMTSAWVMTFLFCNSLVMSASGLFTTRTWIPSTIYFCLTIGIFLYFAYSIIRDIYERPQVATAVNRIRDTLSPSRRGQRSIEIVLSPSISRENEEFLSPRGSHQEQELVDQPRRSPDSSLPAIQMTNFLAVPSDSSPPLISLQPSSSPSPSPRETFTLPLRYEAENELEAEVGT